MTFQINELDPDSAGEMWNKGREKTDKSGKTCKNYLLNIMCESVPVFVYNTIILKSMRLMNSTNQNVHKNEFG